MQWRGHVSQKTSDESGILTYLNELNISFRIRRESLMFF
jgi:hypothetical protein